MPENIVVEKAVTLNNGTKVNIRERTKDEGTILMSFLQYLLAKLAEKGDLNYVLLATEADELSRVLQEKYLFILDALEGKDRVGHGIMIRHASEEEGHVADIIIQVNERYRGNGIGKSILGALIEYGPVKIKGVEKLLAKVQGTNDPAAKICINAGFSVHGIIPGRVQHQQPPIDQLLFVRDLSIAPELLTLPEDGRRAPKYFPHWRETERERQEKIILVGFLCGFDIERFDDVDEGGLWDWASRFVLALADRDPSILNGRTRLEYLQSEALHLIPLRYLRAMAKGLGYVPPI